MFLSSSRLLGTYKPPSGPSDPFFSNVTLLAHMTGPNGSTTYTDVKGHTMTRFNNPVISNTQLLFSENSSYHAAQVDSVYATADAGFEFPGDYTLEFWAYMPAYPVNYVAVFGTLVGAGADQWVFELSNAGHISCYFAGNTNLLASSAGTVSTGAWHHFALTRSGSIVRLFSDGVERASVNFGTATIGSAVRDVYLGGRTNTGGTSNGVFVREFRITKGVARYTGAYTVPTAPFPNF